MIRLLAFLLACSLSIPCLADGPAESIELSPTEREMIDGLNAFRASQNLPAMTPTANLMADARGYAKWMADHIGMGQSTAAFVTQQWIESPGHNRNMRSANEECGVACAFSQSGTPFWIQQFASGSKDWKPGPIPRAAVAAVRLPAKYVSNHRPRRRR